MHEYEIVLLFHPRLSEEQVAAEVENFKSERLGGAKITFEDFWGKKTLAYQIQKLDQATYVVLHFAYDGKHLNKLDEEIRLDKNIIRHLVTAWPKDTPKMTLKEIEAWNKENLAELQVKKKANVEKRAPRRLPVAKRPVVRQEEKPKKELDKAELDKELSAILDN